MTSDKSKIFCVDFQMVILNFTQNILPIQHIFKHTNDLRASAIRFDNCVRLCLKDGLVCLWLVLLLWHQLGVSTSWEINLTQYDHPAQRPSDTEI